MPSITTVACFSVNRIVRLNTRFECLIVRGGGASSTMIHIHDNDLTTSLLATTPQKSSHISSKDKNDHPVSLAPANDPGEPMRSEHRDPDHQYLINTNPNPRIFMCLRLVSSRPQPLFASPYKLRARHMHLRSKLNEDLHVYLQQATVHQDGKAKAISSPTKSIDTILQPHR
jgi:hypothetical protein